MSKRLSDASANDDELEHRTKRRKAAVSPRAGEETSGSKAAVEGDSVDKGSGVVVKEQGLRLWQTIREATNKEGRVLSNDFLRPPSKRQYADYYQIITHPIALDDIKKKIDRGEYDSLEAVRQDLDLCFRNAKQYNMQESVIWNDAKELQKLTRKAFDKMSAPGEAVDGAKKLKAPSLSRLLKSRLQKLVDKTDDGGRILSTEFMELPSKKEWPIYYKDIKQPQCIENIFKHLKRKEYHAAADFAKDVELVFANALQFNQEHTQIWEDARTLRDHFRNLMSDLPPPFALPEYAKASKAKIKLKVPVASQLTATNASSSTLDQTQPLASTSSILLRVPATNLMAKGGAQQPAAESIPTKPETSSSTAPMADSLASKPTATPSSTPGLTTPARQIQPSLLPIAPTLAPRVSTPRPDGSGSRLTPQVIQSSSSSSPAPLGGSRYQLQYVFLRAEPSNRVLCLDHRDGVKTFATRLAVGERSLRITGIRFSSNEEEESSDGEEQRDMGEIAEEDMHADVPAKNGRRSSKVRERGQQTKSASRPAKTEASVKQRKSPQRSEVQVKLNGELVQGTSQEADWLLNLNVGENGLEIGEKGGLTWRLIVERIAD